MQPSAAEAGARQHFPVVGGRSGAPVTLYDPHPEARRWGQEDEDDTEGRRKLMEFLATTKPITKKRPGK